MRKLFLSGIAMCLALSQVVAQTISQQEAVNKLMPKPLPPSPNVAGLGKFGDYQVSHFSGLPEISIPLYEVKSGSLTLPVTLNYHASGVKPTDVSGWVGTGWSLSAGGQISASVRGQSDSEYFYYYPLKPDATTCNDFAYLKNIVNGSMDTEPDVYAYSYPGGSGKAMFLNTAAYDQGLPKPNSGLAFLIPYAPVVLKQTVPGTQFELTDATGNLIRYGMDKRNRKPTENTVTYTGGQQSHATTAFYMTDMIAPNTRDVISMTYQDVGDAHMKDITYAYTITDNCQSEPGASGPSGPVLKPCPTQLYTPQKTTIDITAGQIGLDSIKFKTGLIRFFLGTTRLDVNALEARPLKFLDRIEIYGLIAGAYTLQKVVKFSYSYFKNPGGQNTALKLDAVSFQDNAGVVIQRYRFNYTTTTFSWTAGTDATLNGRDLWGYYNGASNTDLLLPRTVDYQDVLGSPTTKTFGGATNRAVNETLMKEGVLSRIDFPTGGYTKFDYEANRYLNGSTPTLTGGLRVTAITSAESLTAPATVKTYKYGASESGYGTANFSDYQYTYFTEQAWHEEKCIPEDASLSYRLRTYQSNSSFYQDAFDAAPVLYGTVTEYIQNGSNGKLGKTIYTYNTVTDPADQLVQGSNKYYHNSYAWKRGQLTGKAVYDSLGAIVYSQSITYTPYQETANTIGLGVFRFSPRADEVCITGICSLSNHYFTQTFKTQAFTQSTGVFLPTTISEKTYMNGNASRFVEKLTINTYELTNYQVTNTTTTQGNGYEQRVVVNRYPFQMQTMNESATSGAAKGIAMMRRKHIVGVPIETYAYLQKNDNTNQRVVSGQVTTFRQHTADTSFVVADKIYLWESDTAIAKANYVQLSINAAKNGVTMDGVFKQRVSLLSYDYDGNLQMVQKDNNPVLSYLYGYNGSVPIAEVVNAQNTQYKIVTTKIPSTGSLPVTLGTSSANTITGTYNFKIDYAGPVTLKLGVPGSVATNFNCMGAGAASGSLPIGACGGGTYTINGAAVGDNYLTVTVYNTPGTPGGVGACGEIIYPKYITQVNTFGTIEFLTESFEENTAANVLRNATVAHSGEAYYNGDYTVVFTKPNTRAYFVDYYYLDATNKWVYIQKVYNTTSMILSEGSAIDDVRIYPQDAQIKTYTYIPNVGTTSSIDPNGKGQFYSYDTFGRLKVTRDTNFNILKMYDYYYRYQP
ncbi:hypothetical protein [Chryseolinea lacunae]|uniref:YD repeat-containing protein n=1 Tax=Chryseolinea lacunae TaxID=2801331 RepID=A0ABS1L4T1_9BACT|nr:hypothetical protein [Chryseolinea lacunae]MBL0745927.1 hypothetical protein [Chryseolinea lacunae]